MYIDKEHFPKTIEILSNCNIFHGDNKKQVDNKKDCELN